MFQWMNFLNPDENKFRKDDFIDIFNTLNPFNGNREPNLFERLAARGGVIFNEALSSNFQPLQKAIEEVTTFTLNEIERFSSTNVMDTSTEKQDKPAVLSFPVKLHSTASLTAMMVHDDNEIKAMNKETESTPVKQSVRPKGEKLQALLRYHQEQIDLASEARHIERSAPQITNQVKTHIIFFSTNETRDKLLTSSSNLKHV